MNGIDKVRHKRTQVLENHVTLARNITPLGISVGILLAMVETAADWIDDCVQGPELLANMNFADPAYMMLPRAVSAPVAGESAWPQWPPFHEPATPLSLPHAQSEPPVHYSSSASPVQQPTSAGAPVAAPNTDDALNAALASIFTACRVSRDSSP